MALVVPHPTEVLPLREDNSNRALIDRQTAQADIEKFFSETLDLLAEVIDDGTQLIARLMGTVEPSVQRDMSVGGLLSTVVQSLDAIEVLCRSGCVPTAGVSARSLLEASLCGEWILKDDTVRRANAYYISGLRRELLWCRRYIPGTDEHKRIRESIQASDVGIRDPGDDPAMRAQAEERAAQIESWLNRGDLRDLNGLLAKQRGRRPNEPPWYAAFEMTLRSIATELRKGGIYDLFYSMWSDSVHASYHRSRMEHGDGTVGIYALRHMGGASTLFETVLSLTFGTFRTFLRHFRPEEDANFDRKYREEWRVRFRSIPQVDVKHVVKRSPFA